MEHSPIFFMKVNEPYGEFTNFHQTGFRYDHREWKTSEHCYQAMKFSEFHVQEEIRLQPNAFMAAKVGRETNTTMRFNWDNIRENYMSDIVYAKFTQNPLLKQMLISTGDRLLVELSYKDNYWGSKPDLSGRNRLGHILMQLRNLYNVIG